MKKILGLDLGTTSIGWAVVNQAESHEEQSSIIKLGVRVNPLTVDEKGDFEKGKSVSTTAERTLKRSMRRNLQRYKLRRNALKEILTKNNIISPETPLAEIGENSTYQTLELRARAAHEEISLSEFARVLLNINKKRGYKSNRKAKNDEGGELIDGMDIAMTLKNRGLTPAELCLERMKKLQNYRLAFYPSDLKAEFLKIWEAQAAFYPTILTHDNLNKVLGMSRRDTIKYFKDNFAIVAAEEKDRKIRTATYIHWRVNALHQKAMLERLATVLAEINGAIAAASGYLGAIGDHSKELITRGITVGEYLYDLIRQNRHNSLKNIVFYRTDYISEFNIIWDTQAQFHPELTSQLKKQVADSIIFFQRRLKSQKGFISICELEGKEITLPNGKEVKTGPRVCPKSSPLFQEFKIWQNLNNVLLERKNIKTKKNALSSHFDNNYPPERYVPLTQEQKDTLHAELSTVRELKSAEVFKLLNLPPKEYSLNFKTLQGNTTQVTLMNAYKKILEMAGNDVTGFDKLPSAQKTLKVQEAFKMMGAKTDFLFFDEGNGNNSLRDNAMFRLWHLLYSYEDDKTPTGDGKLVKHIMELTGLPKDYARVLAKVTFVQDYGSLSSKAMSKILKFMKQDGKIYSEACELAGYKHSKRSITATENENRLLATHIHLLPKNTLRNPVVEKILNQMIHVVNNCVEQYGQFDEIHIEMARNLKQTKEQRELATKHLSERTRDNERVIAILHGEPFNIPRPSRNDILRYRLYEELKNNSFRTLYSNTYISREDLFTPNFDIEHIIPQSRLFDDSYNNKTLEARGVNIEKSDMTAIDYVRMKYGEQGVEEFKKRIEFLNNSLTRKKHKNLLTSVSEIKSDFLNRDLGDTQYIARKASELLLNITPAVIFTTGAVTARLREDWQLVDVMKELNWEKYEALGLTTTERNRDGHELRIIEGWTKRNDHRHHAMDALTVAFTRRVHIQYLNSLNAKGTDGNKDATTYAIERKELLNGRRFIAPIPPEQFRAQAISHLGNILVSIKAKNKVTTKSTNKIKGAAPQATLTPRGQLHNETVYGSRHRYSTRVEKVGAAFTLEKINTVCRKDYRDALLKRLEQHGGDPKKAFTGKNTLAKVPLFVDDKHSAKVPEKVKTVVLEQYFTIRKLIDKDIKIDKVVDEGIKRILQKRKDEMGDAAFVNLDENPIWLNKEKGIAIKRVTIKGVNVAIPLHVKRDHQGNAIIDSNGEQIPTDFVSTSNNHHVAIFQDSDGNLQEHVVSLFEATERKRQGLQPVDYDYNSHLGWKFLFTMKQNEYFVFPNEEQGFLPEEIDLMNPSNSKIISPNLFRVQKLSTGDYFFRHHLETNVELKQELKDTTWKRLSLKGLKGIVKVRVNHLGQIVKVGEYR